MKEEYNCDFCGKKCKGTKFVLKDLELEKKDGGDILLCSDCLNYYVNREYDKIKLKEKKNE